MVCAEVRKDMMNDREGESLCVVSHAIQPAGDVSSGGNDAGVTLAKRFPCEKMGFNFVQGDAAFCVPAKSCCAIGAVKRVLKEFHLRKFEEHLCDVRSEFEGVYAEALVLVLCSPQFELEMWRQRELPNIWCAMDVEKDTT